MQAGDNFVVIRSRQADTENRTGVLLSGGCDLATAFTAAPLLGETLTGALAMANIGTGSVLGSHRTDQILQTIEGSVDGVDTTEVTDLLNLTPHYFSPRLFTEPDFEIPDAARFGRFPKTVIVLSIGSDLVRSIFRHKEHGYLVDPGGFWLNNLSDRTLPDPEVARWFKKNFESVGRLDVDEFVENMEAVIRLIRQKTGAHVLVYNSLVVEPGSPHHNYQLLPTAHPLRRREFNLALTELSAKLDFHVVDVDRILKEVGVVEQVDFAHIPTEKARPIGEEVHRILRELEVVA